jgi:glycosidase
MSRTYISACLLSLNICLHSLAAQDISIERIDPPNWWSGMLHNEIQLLVYGDNIAAADKVVIDGDAMQLQSVTRLANPNYLFLDVKIADFADPGYYTMHFHQGERVISRDYLIEQRHDHPGEHQGFDGSDVIYLLMPDRFANGDPSNDVYEGMTDTFDRSHNLMRHGGDLDGIIEHLDYFNKLGVTALWLNPVQENDMYRESYHGYAITDMYRIDRRLGTNATYRSLVERAHKMDLKVIMDMVVNHFGTNNYIIRDLPADDWIHQYPEFTRTNYRGVMQLDPYAAGSDLKLMNDGWFDITMADMNQQNPFVAKYLIQCTLWWIEFAGLDGIRMDTYSYPDKHFLADWAQAVFDEYPAFNIVGEVWEYKSATQAYWLSGANHPGDYDSRIHSLTDFVLKQALDYAFNEDEGWDKGLARIYYTLTEDRLYPDPNQMVTFIDNHDVARYFSVVGEDMAKMKMATAALLTLRGVPQLYYGSELGFTGWSHGEVRPEMFGGWPDHEKNAFTGEGLSAREKEMQDYTLKLLQWRKETPVVHHGKLMHYVPQDKTYVYFRYDDHHCVMVILNRHEQGYELQLDRFEERLQGYFRASDVISGEQFELGGSIDLEPNSATILQLTE